MTFPHPQMSLFASEVSWTAPELLTQKLLHAFDHPYCLLNIFSISVFCLEWGDQNCVQCSKQQGTRALYGGTIMFSVLFACSEPWAEHNAVTELVATRYCSRSGNGHFWASLFISGVGTGFASIQYLVFTDTSFHSPCVSLPTQWI